MHQALRAAVLLVPVDPNHEDPDVHRADECQSQSLLFLLFVLTDLVRVWDPRSVLLDPLALELDLRSRLRRERVQQRLMCFDVVTDVDMLFRELSVDYVDADRSELEGYPSVEIQLPRRPDDLRFVAVELLHLEQTVRLVAHDHCFLGAAHDCSC